MTKVTRGHEKDFGQDRDFTSLPEFSWKVKRYWGSFLENYYSREDFQGEKKKKLGSIDPLGPGQSYKFQVL